MVFHCVAEPRFIYPLTQLTHGWILGLFLSLASGNNAAVNIGLMYLNTCFQFSWVYFCTRTRTQVLGPMVTLGSTRAFPTAAAIPHPTSRVGGFQLLRTSADTCRCPVLDSSRPYGCEVTSHCHFDRMSLVTDGVEHLFMHSGHLQNFFWRENTGLSVSWLLSCMSSSYRFVFAEYDHSPPWGSGWIFRPQECPLLSRNVAITVLPLRHSMETGVFSVDFSGPLTG